MVGVADVRWNPSCPVPLPQMAIDLGDPQMAFLFLVEKISDRNGWVSDVDTTKVPLRIMLIK